MNIRISEKHFREMRKLTNASFFDDANFAPETGCILLVGKNTHPASPALLVQAVLPPEEGDFTRQSGFALTFSSRYLRRALLRVRELGLAGFLTVHTHPFSDDTVEFSDYDDANDPELMRNLYDLQPEGAFGSLVLGKQAIAGRIWQSGFSQPLQLDEMIIVGEELNFVSLDGQIQRLTPSPSEIFDSSCAMTGAGALTHLSKMRIAVIGVSGTGSLVAELLLRAGAGEIVLFEFDHIEKRNLNRILHSRVQDAENNAEKSARIAEALNEIGLQTRVTVVEKGDIRKAETARELCGVDFIFGCVDNSDWARLVMTEIAYQYLIPFIDLGVEISIGASQVQSVDSRVSYVAADKACLICSGIVSEERLRLEGLATSEKERVLAMGYSKDVQLNAPAVMDLNMRAASYASLVLRHLLQPFMDAPLPAHIKESLTTFSIRKLPCASRDGCHICGAEGRLGLGEGRRLTVG